MGMRRRGAFRIPRADAINIAAQGLGNQNGRPGNMDLNIPEDLRMVQTTVRTFVENEIIPYEREYHDDYELPDEIRLPLWEQVKDLGLWNLGVPAEFGGGGLDTLGWCLSEEETYKTWLSARIFDGGAPSLR